MRISAEQFSQEVKSLGEQVLVPAIEEQIRIRMEEFRKELLAEVDVRVERATEKEVKNAVDDKLYAGQQKLAETLNRVVVELTK